MGLVDFFTSAAPERQTNEEPNTWKKKYSEKRTIRDSCGGYCDT